MPERTGGLVRGAGIVVVGISAGLLHPKHVAKILDDDLLRHRVLTSMHVITELRFLSEFPVLAFENRLEVDRSLAMGIPIDRGNLPR